MFSATFSGEVNDRIKDLIKESGQSDDPEANQIELRNNAALKLDHVKQFWYRCAYRTKIDFLMKVFETCQMTQTVIFINTLNFAEIVHNKLREKGYKSTIIFSRMTHQERDEFVEKFRKGEVNVIITTNMLSRGLDVPEIQLVINFDVPKVKSRGKFVIDAESYQHRIGRAGRFGV